MKTLLAASLLLLIHFSVFAQNAEEETGGFRKENMFTGGNISLSFFYNTFLVGASPVLGYRLGSFADAGMVVNFQRTSVRDYGGVFNSKFRQTLYGAGAFARVYPVNFIFGQVQYEYNFITEKYIPPTGPVEKNTVSGNSLLVGGGYASGRTGYGNNPFFYMCLLWEVAGNPSSPYIDAYDRPFPVIRAGFNIPLFQGRRLR